MPDEYQFNVQFCNLIENHPVLYDYNRPEYCNRNGQDQAWEIIARTLNDNVKDCKGRWSNIRNRYAKYKKSKLLPSGSAAKVVKEYYLGPHLQFLDTYMKSRPSKSNFKPTHMEADDSDADEEDSISPYPPPSVSPSPQIENMFNASLPLLAGSSKKSTTPTFKDVNQSAFNYFTPKRLRANQEKQSELDTDLSFLQSMLPDMKAMKLAEKRRFKMGVMQLATQILDENETTTNTAYSSCNTKYNIVPYAPPSATQQTIQNIAPPAIHQANLNVASPTTHQPNLNVASPSTQQNVASSSIHRHFQDSREDADNPTYFTLSPYSAISSLSSTHNNTQYYNEETPLPNNDYNDF